MEIEIKNVSCHSADSKPVKQEVNGTVILPPLVFPEYTNLTGTTNPFDSKRVDQGTLTKAKAKYLFLY